MDPVWEFKAPQFVDFNNLENDDNADKFFEDVDSASTMARFITPAAKKENVSDNMNAKIKAHDDGPRRPPNMVTSWGSKLVKKTTMAGVRPIKAKLAGMQNLQPHTGRLESKESLPSWAKRGLDASKMSSSLQGKGSNQSQGLKRSHQQSPNMKRSHRMSPQTFPRLKRLGTNSASRTHVFSTPVGQVRVKSQARQELGVKQGPSLLPSFRPRMNPTTLPGTSRPERSKRTVATITRGASQVHRNKTTASARKIPRSPNAPMMQRLARTEMVTRPKIMARAPSNKVPVRGVTSSKARKESREVFPEAPPQIHVVTSPKSSACTSQSRITINGRAEEENSSETRLNSLAGHLPKPMTGEEVGVVTDVMAQEKRPDDPLFKVTLLPRRREGEMPARPGAAATKLGVEVPARRAVSVTKPEPFSFSVTEEELQRRRKEKVQQLLLEEKSAHPLFQAKPFPRPGAGGIVPDKQVLNITRPEPFKLRMEERLGGRVVKREEALAQELEEQKKAMVFKAAEAKVIGAPPFLPKLAEKSPTEAVGPTFHTDRRMEEREIFEQVKREKEAQREEARRQVEEQKAKEEQEEVARLRRLTIHRAQPVKTAKPLVLQPSVRPLTRPVSPLLGLKGRANRTGSGM